MGSRETAEHRSGRVSEAETLAAPGSGFSLLLASATARLCLVAVAVGLLWLSVLWALA